MQTEQKTLSEKLREYRQKVGWNKSMFCRATGINFHSYTHIEPTDNNLTPRPIGLKIYKKIVEFFRYDTDMTKALLRYATLDPTALLRMLVADAWVGVEDEMPPPFEQVNILYIRDGYKRVVTSGRYSNIKNQWDLYGFGYVNKDTDSRVVRVIAWQPLPEPLRVTEADEAGEVAKALLKINDKEKVSDE